MKRGVSSAFFNGLRRSDARICKCWRIETTDGLVLGFTEHDKPLTLTIDGNVEVYKPNNAFSSSAFTQRSDFSVSNINVASLTSDDITEKDLHAGRFDNALVRIFYVQWDHTEWGTMPIVGARLGEMTLTNGQFETELRSMAQALQQQQGRVFSLECDTDLGSLACGVDITPFTFTGEVTGVYDNITFFDTSRTEADDYFQYGMVTFTSGDNEGASMEVKGYKLAGPLIVTLEPLGYPVQIGDTYEIVAGCDKTCDTCKAKFSNLDNFQGFPHMPTEQEATQTPDAKTPE